MPGEILSLEEPLQNGQKLVAEVKRYEKDNPQPYEKIKWQLQSSDEWEADRSLDVYTGQEH